MRPLISGGKAEQPHPSIIFRKLPCCIDPRLLPGLHCRSTSKRFEKETSVSVRFYAVLCSAAAISLWAYAQEMVTQVGYALVTADAGNRLPASTTLVSFRNSQGILVSQYGAGATQPTLSGRIFVDESSARTATAIALVNASNKAASINLVLRNASGIQVASRPVSLPPWQHLAKYISQLFGDLPGFTGTLTFESDQPVAALTLKESKNAFGEVVYSTLPVVDLTAAVLMEPSIFPHLAAGGGYTTQLLLFNGTDQPIFGNVRFISQQGASLS